MDKVEETENLDSAGDYKAAAESAEDLKSILDRLDAGSLNREALENVRTASAELGQVIANLPLAFGLDAQKIRFSDIPPALQDLMEDMVDRVYDKLEEEDAQNPDKDAEEALSKLETFMSGGDYFNQGEISSSMSKMLRLLT